ncbi:MAG: site-specific integrase [Candidatus Omnitrophica bacterium]|nr:site-specific integrase [Candidatus Omnitrophota bacterium]
MTDNLPDKIVDLPGVAEGLRRIARIFESVKSFEDVERVFLKGAGLAATTYRSYLAAVRDFYAHTGGLNPLQVTPAMIEDWYDTLSKRVGRGTAYCRVQGLKRFFRGVGAVVPFYISPFDIMNEKLIQKLSRTKKGNRTKPALSWSELTAVMAWLGSLPTLRARQDRALLLFLATSGLRAAEFCQLRWGDVQEREGMLSVTFTGKGATDAEQEVYKPALDALREVFREQHRRDPQPIDAIAWTLPWERTRAAAPMNYAVLYSRIRDLGVAARKAGIISRPFVWSPHALRRTYCTILSKSGMDLASISKKMRHARISGLTEYIDTNETAGPYLEKMIK